MAERIRSGIDTLAPPERRLLKYSTATYVRALTGRPEFLNPDTPLTPDIFAHLQDRPVVIDTAAHFTWREARTTQHESRKTRGIQIERSDGHVVAYKDASHQEQVRWWAEQVATRITTRFAPNGNAPLLLEGLKALGYAPTTQEALGPEHQAALVNFLSGSFFREKAGNDAEKSVGSVTEDLRQRFLQVGSQQDMGAAIAHYEGVVTALDPLFSYIYDAKTKKLLDISLGCPAAKIIITPESALSDIPEEEKPTLREVHTVVTSVLPSLKDGKPVFSTRQGVSSRSGDVVRHERPTREGGRARRRKSRADDDVVIQLNPPDNVVDALPSVDMGVSLEGLGEDLLGIAEATPFPPSAFDSPDAPQLLLPGRPPMGLLPSPTDEGPLLPQSVLPYPPSPLGGLDMNDMRDMLPYFFAGQGIFADDARRREISSPSIPLLAAPAEDDVLLPPLLVDTSPEQIPVAAMQRAPDTGVLTQTLEAQVQLMQLKELPRIETIYEYTHFAGTVLEALGEIDSYKMHIDALEGTNYLQREERVKRQAHVRKLLAGSQQKLLLALPEGFFEKASDGDRFSLERMKEGKAPYPERVAFVQRRFAERMKVEDVRLDETALMESIRDAHTYFEEELPELFVQFLIHNRPGPVEMQHQTELRYRALVTANQFGYVPQAQQLYQLAATIAGKSPFDPSNDAVGWKRLQYMQLGPLLAALDREFELHILDGERERRLRETQQALDDLEQKLYGTEEKQGEGPTLAAS